MSAKFNINGEVVFARVIVHRGQNYILKGFVSHYFGRQVAKALCRTRSENHGPIILLNRFRYWYDTYWCNQVRKPSVTWTHSVRAGDALVRAIYLADELYVSALDISGLAREFVESVCAREKIPWELETVKIKGGNGRTRVITYECAREILKRVSKVDVKLAISWLTINGFNKRNHLKYRPDLPELVDYPLTEAPPRTLAMDVPPVRAEWQVELEELFDFQLIM